MVCSFNVADHFDYERGRMKNFLSNESGATAIEYGLICALIVIACVAGITALGGGTNGMWETRVNGPVSTAL